MLSIIVNGEGRPTRIMYEANLSWKRLEEILDYLETSKLITSERITGYNDRPRSLISATYRGAELMGNAREALDALAPANSSEVWIFPG